MEDADIDLLLENGWWIQVSPVMLDDRNMWTCAIYKKTKKFWVTDKVKSFPTPNKCYEWALDILTDMFNGGRE